MMNRTRPAATAALALACALFAGAASTAEPGPSATPAAAPEAVAAAAAPEVHDHPIAARDEAALRFVEHADGTVSATLDASFLSTAVAKIGPDGEVVIGCVQSRQEYEAFFAAEALPGGAEVR